MAAGIGNAQSAKAGILKLLHAIQSRSASYSFRLVQGHLRAHDMPSSSGWVPLLAKYETLNYDAIPTLWADYTAALRKLLRYTLRCGTSAVWFFEGTTAELNALAGVFPALVDDTSPFHQAFPFPLGETELLSQSMTPVRTKYISVDEGQEHVLFMCGKRAFREREPVLVEDMGDQVRDAFQRYEEVIGVRSGYTQAFDRFNVRPQAGVLELHIDLCCPLNVEELAQYCVTHVSRLKTAVRESTGDQLRWLGEAKNLFPRIAHLYNTECGRVLSLGHATGTKSIKEERMRGRSLDLREELFHKHGIEAIQDTDAYAIKKGWQSDTGTHVPSVSISGHYSRAGAANAAVRHAVFESCANIDDLNLIRDKLLS